MREAEPGDAVLLLGNYRATLDVARAFHECGYKVVVSRDWPDGFVQYSRYVDACWDNPHSDDLDVEAAQLSAFLAAHRQIRIVFPVMEKYVKLLALFPAAVSETVLVASPDTDTVLTCLDKEAMANVAKTAGLAIGAARSVSNLEELKRAAAAIGAPLVIKPIESGMRLHEKKALIIEEASALDEILPRWPDDHERLVVQRYISGQRINIYFGALNGEPVRCLVARVLSTDAPDGTGYNTSSISIEMTDAILSATKAALGALDYSGAGLLQFMEDGNTGALTFLEINPRLAANQGVADAGGLELVDFAVAAAAGDADKVDVRVAEPGLRFQWTSAALFSTARAFGRSQISLGEAASQFAGILRSSLSVDVRGTWRNHDPLPAIVFIARRTPIVGGVLSNRAKRMKPMD